MRGRPDRCACRPSSLRGVDLGGGLCRGAFCFVDPLGGLDGHLPRMRALAIDEVCINDRGRVLQRATKTLAIDDLTDLPMSPRRSRRALPHPWPSRPARCRCGQHHWAMGLARRIFQMPLNGEPLKEVGSSHYLYHVFLLPVAAVSHQR